MDKYIVSCFYTKDTPYEEVFFKFLKISLDRLNIPYTVDVMQNKGSWYKNVAMKPFTLLRALEKYDDCNVVGIDVDAEITKEPVLLNNIPKQFDIACHFLNWKEWYGHEVDIEELLSGTIFLRNSPKVKKLVEEWYNLAMSSEEWEQKCLQRLLKDNKEFNIYKLPIEYTYISSLPDGKPPRVQVSSPVIIHHQASRKYRKHL